MNEITLVSASGVATTPTLSIITGGIFPPSVSSQMIVVSQSNFLTSTNNFPPLVVGPTQDMSAVASLPSKINVSSYGMPFIDMLNALDASHSMSHAYSVG
jgi:hypothetical protein